MNNTKYIISDKVLYNNKIHDVSKLNIEKELVEIIKYKRCYHNEFQKKYEELNFDNVRFLKKYLTGENYTHEEGAFILYEGDMVIFSYSGVCGKTIGIGYITYNNGKWDEKFKITGIGLANTFEEIQNKNKDKKAHKQYSLQNVDIAEKCSYCGEEINIYDIKSYEYDELTKIYDRYKK